MAVTYLDRFWEGTWIKVPALEVNGKTIIVTGNWLRIAGVDAEECLERELEDPEVCISSLKEHQSRNMTADIFTFAQKLPATKPRFAYPVEWDSVAAMRLTSFSDWWDSLPQESRKNTRRSAKRGVVIRIETLDDNIVRGIVAINDETPIRQGRRFSHFGENFDRVKQDFLSFGNRSDLICAYFEDELIGLLKIIYCGPIAAIMKLQTKISHYDKRPANALMAKAFERCAEKAASYVTYGKFRYGNQGQTSLMDFKVRHGFGEMLVPRYYVPLTTRGRVGTSLKLHRDLVGLLPPRAVDVGRRIRAKWNK
jgi:hypothetical protein